MAILYDTEYSPSKVIALQEAYYGKSQELLTIEKELKKIIGKINKMTEIDGEKIKIDEDPKSLAKSDSVKLIERTFKKMFKLKDFCLCFYTAIPIGVLFRPDMNAYTWGKGFNCFRKKQSSKRVDSTDMIVGVNVDIGIVRYLKLEADELMAIIMHEIGHNMSASPLQLFANLHTFIPLVDIARILMKEYLLPGVSKVNQGIETAIEHIPLLKGLFSGLATLRVNLQALLPLNVLAILNPLNLIRALSPANIFGFTEEKYADSFTTAYGYGPALAKAFDKMEHMPGVHSVKIVQKIPVLNVGYDLLKVSGNMATRILDEHPSNPSRIKAQLTKLKRDLKDPSIDPRYKKLIEEDIKSLEDFINNEYLDMTQDAKKGRIFSNIYKNASIKIFGGSADPRELFKFAADKIEE